MGGAVTWGEAKDLIESHATDLSTVLGADMAGWAYPASFKDILMLSATIRDPKVSKQLMPWAIKSPEGSDATAEEIAEAEAALEDGIVFS